MSTRAQKITNNITLLLAVAGLGLFATNAWLINGAQAKQRMLVERQGQINAGIQVSQLNGELVRVLGAASIAQKDDKIKSMLAEHGITVEPEANAANGAARRAPAAQ